MLGMPVTTTLVELVVGIMSTKWRTTLELEDKGVNGVKFKDTIGALGMFDSETLTCRGYAPPADMDEFMV